MSTEDAAARSKRVGAVIRRRRQALGWEQRELAGRVGVHVNSVQKWESGTHYPGRKLGKLEAVLGIRLDGEPEPEPDILPEGLRDDIRAVVQDKERAAVVESLVEAALRGEPLPSRRRRAAPLALPSAPPPARLPGARSS